VRLKDDKIPVTPGLLGVWVNRALARAGKPGHRLARIGHIGS
jgi:hypothetical protein